MTDQDEVFAFLRSAQTYGGHPVSEIETLSARIFLAGERALKVKRAVRLPFLDFSTLEKRQRVCEAEIAINRTFAPDLYHGVIAITREADGSLALGGAGHPVEYAVDMTRFDENRTLDKLPADQFTDELAVALGERVAHAHQCAPRAEVATWLGEVGAIIAANDVELRKALAEEPNAAIPNEAIGALTAKARARLADLMPLLRARGAAGEVRRGHGDLHLGNIALIDGAPALFDALEFDPTLASGDVLYDLAFLLMDLVARGAARQANIVLNRYLAASEDPLALAALAALPLFLAMRAAIRAKLHAALACQLEGADRAAAKQRSAAYVALALRAIAPPPALVAIGGLSGTGKSVLARDLAPAIGALPGAIIVRSDVVRKEMFGLAQTQKLPQEAYSAETTAKVYALMIERCERILRAGHGAIADAVFARADEREALAEAARRAGTPFLGLMLTAECDTRIARVSARRGDASDADAALARAQEAYDFGPCDWARINAGGTPNETAANARKALAAAKAI